MNKEVAISLPFSIDPYGRVTQSTDQAKIWSDRVKSVIGTGLKERVMRVALGSDIPSTIFDSQTAATDKIDREVRDAFSTQLGLLTLTSVSSTYDAYTGIMNVFITYDLPNNEKSNVNIGLATISGNAPIIQEML